MLESKPHCFAQTVYLYHLILWTWGSDSAVILAGVSCLVAQYLPVHPHHDLYLYTFFRENLRCNICGFWMRLREKMSVLDGTNANIIELQQHMPQYSYNFTRQKDLVCLCKSKSTIEHVWHLIINMKRSHLHQSLNQPISSVSACFLCYSGVPHVPLWDKNMNFLLNYHINLLYSTFTQPLFLLENTISPLWV